jgi:nicotinamidase-related amidase
VLPKTWQPPLSSEDMDHQQIIVQKGELDAFSHPAMDEIVDKFKRPPAIVFGVATEHCVRLACLGLLERGCKVNLILNATRPVRESAGRETIEELKEKGVEFITSAEVMRVAV